MRVRGYISNAKSAGHKKCLGNGVVEEGSAKFGSTACSGKKRIRRFGRIF